MQAMKQLELLGSPKQMAWHIQNVHPSENMHSFRKRVSAITVFVWNDCSDYFTEDWCAVQNKSDKDALDTP